MKDKISFRLDKLYIDQNSNTKLSTAKILSDEQAQEWIAEHKKHFVQPKGESKNEYFEPFVNPINRDAHTFILNKIIANPLWKQMERYYRLINAIVKTCPDHIRTDHCDRDQIVSHLKRLKLKSKNEMNKTEAVVHNTYLVNKHLKPVDIAVEYGVTMSIIGREGNKSITKVEGDEADIAQFVKDFDAEEFDIADAASPAGVDEAVEDAFKASTSVETARMAMVKRIAKDAPVSTYRSKVGKIIIYTWKNKRWNMMQFMANKAKPYSAISYQSETDLAYALKYALSHAASTPINKPNAKGHGIKVGDIFVDSWGATMQLNHFYKIVDLPSPVMAVVQKLRGDRTETGRFGGAGTEVPTDKHDGSPKKVKLAKDTNGNITFKTDVNSRAHPWNGKPMAYDTND